MTQTKAQHRRGAHLLLLTALLLYIGSLAVEPVVHATASAAPADVVLADADEENTPPAAEHECSVCKLTRVFSNPAAAAVPSLTVATLVGASIPADLQIRGPPALPSSQPRAPPHA